MNRRLLQALLVVLGGVMVVAGLGTVLLGAGSIVGVGEVTPEVDSEMRFYAVWYAVAGAGLLRAVPRVEAAATTVRVVGLAFFVAGCARALSWLTVGRPHPFALVLMAIELVLPVVIVPWQASMREPDPSR